jgi:uncharacterized protein YecT (DUF1311 family)
MHQRTSCLFCIDFTKLQLKPPFGSIHQHEVTLMRLLFGLTVMALSASIPTGAAMAHNIDCANARTTPEINFCAAEAALNDIDKQELAAIAKSNGEQPNDPKSREAALHRSRRLWVAYRDAHCESVERMPWMGTTALECMTQLTQDYIRALKERAAKPEGPPRVP